MGESASRAERTPFVGPIFFWELVRQSRKGRGHLPRVLFAAAVLIILFLLLGVQEITQKNAAYLSEYAAQLYLTVQYCAILVLTPFSVAGAFIEERQQNTLTLLLTTALSPREIVLGKLLGRLIHVAGALLAGLPILGLLQLLGGVNVNDLLLHSFLALLLLMICGMYAIRASTLCRTIGGAIFVTYGMLLAGYLLSMLLAVPLTAYLTALQVGIPMVIWWSLVVVLNLLFSLLFLRNAVLSIKKREPDRDYGSAPQLDGSQDPFLQHKMIVVRVPAVVSRTTDEATVVNGNALPSAVATTVMHRAVRWKHLPGIWNWPLAWKDTYFPLSDVDVLMAAVCCGLPLTVFISSLVTHETFVSVRPFVLWCCNVLMLVLLVMTTLRAAGMFSQERLKQTLLSLLGVPLSRWEILGQVWLGSISRFYAFALGTAVMCIVAGIHSPWFLAVNLPVFLGQLAFFSLLGVYASLGRMTPFQARFLFLGYFFIGVFVLPSFLLTGLIQVPNFLVVLLCPYQTWFMLAEPITSLLVSCLLTGSLFILAERRLKRLQESL